ncbi:helix-turn-helix domain-containing protein [Actinoplanes friuliensis]|uniref:AraC family transcriptional regulator n=1 Tax=Actinoplanes friuliensis DSM 7358 TaxID=1246995 RepID=U5VV38_9ACTN|nr:helix-turn-helix domain-containing protein [Actinoplanes friuliensis]AGZ40662.1 AraC family transcriptional regulator [Actinoplanes friuliensis DSM 7358]
MALLLDTRNLPPRESADAVYATLTSPSAPASVRLSPGIRSLIEGWPIGAGMTLLSNDSSGGLHMQRTARHVRADSPERLSLTLDTRGICDARQFQTIVRRRNELHLLDLTSVYESRWRGAFAATAFLADYTALGFPVDVARAVIPLVRTSPLHDLTMRHLRDLPAIARRTAPGPALGMLGVATADLVRALIASVAPGNPHSRAAHARSLRTVVLAYIDAHLHEPGLTPARVAAEHKVSLRYLYQLFADEAESPAEAIWQRRLEGARRELAHRATHHILISATARRWGFTDPRHFARRFRAAYGISPGDWVRMHLGDD